MATIDATLRHALEVTGGDLILTLDPALAVFDALAGATGPRELTGLYRRRVPLGLPLTLKRAREDSAETFVLCDQSDGVLVDGRVVPAGPPSPYPLVGNGAERHPLPISRTCFACGTDNEL